MAYTQYSTNDGLGSLTRKYSNWCVIDLPRISYREYQLIRKPIMSKLGQLHNQGYVFALPAISQSIHFMEALMNMNAKFVVVLPRTISDENMYIRNKLEKVEAYDKAFIVEHASRSDEIVEDAKQALRNSNISNAQYAWASETIEDPDRADYIDGLRHREHEFNSIINVKTNNTVFIAIFRDGPQYLSEKVQDRIPVWNLNLNSIRKKVKN